MTQQDAGGVLTAGQVGERLGLKPGMVRRYALALEEVTGISLEVDPIRGRLYPREVVELLEGTRAHLLAHPGQSVEGAMRAVTGQSEAGITPAARVPGALTRDELAVMLADALTPALAPITAELTATRAEVGMLRDLVADLAANLPQRITRDLVAELPGNLAANLTPDLVRQIEASTAASITAELAHRAAPDLTPELLAEVEALRAQVARVEVTAHAAAGAAAYQRDRRGVFGLLRRLLGR